ncbi:hypothetical protein GCM10009846_00600 [Agrococcus versicolor]|uniref:Carbohydrate ABC transporter substrate-binding protein n=1 Tax=Agrococcus versicolor TaxID=501482 RepID=A0ABP5M8R6_9MICO
MRLSRIATTSVACAAAFALAACSTGSDPEPAASQEPTGPSLRMLVDGTPAEVDALQAEVDAWSEDSGSSVRIVLASDLEQQLAESFANANPPDVFALSTTMLERYDGYLEAYGRLATADDLVPWLLDAVASGGELQCAPRSVDATMLAISEDAWAEAGLGDGDVPTTWEQLEAIGARLTTDDRAGLAIDPDAAHLGVLLAQAGGTLVDEAGAAADSPENVAALDLVQRMVEAETLAWPADLDAGSAAEALATGDAAMAYVDLEALLAAEAAAPAPSEEPSEEPGEGSDPDAPAGSAEPSATQDPAASDDPAASASPSTSPSATAEDDADQDDAEQDATDASSLLEGVRLVPLPVGPANGATFATATCWALPADTRTGDEARDLVAALLEPEAQVALADATGTVPVTTSGGTAFAEAHPERAPVVDAVASATSLETALGPQEATDALDETLATLASAGVEADAPALLAELQERLEQQLDEG